jgi:hypothetical protein
MSRGTLTRGGCGAATSGRPREGEQYSKMNFKKSPPLNRALDADAVETEDEAHNIPRYFNRRIRMSSIFYVVGVVVGVVAVLGYFNVI